MTRAVDSEVVDMGHLRAAGAARIDQFVSR
jgi:hypothetical protein